MGVYDQGCLNIPLPRCIGELVKAPPVPVSHPGDGNVLDLLIEFGRKYNRDINEIRQACDLAEGYSDLVIILQRPAPRHNYSVDFEKFVADCPTLDAVDKLIRYASKGTRSIETVSVFDAYSFKPGLTAAWPSDDDCHLLLEQMLKFKKPRVVMCCWNKGAATCSNEFVGQFVGGGVGNPSIRDEIDIEGCSSVAIRCFHPATAMCYNPYNADYQALLTYHFIAAFSELSYRIHEPWWLEQINTRSMHAIKWQRNDRLDTPDAYDRI
ncbi:hypothetical protein VE04_09240, partial [Pseudogymnoascus sp. 24MN13]